MGFELKRYRTSFFWYFLTLLCFLESTFGQDTILRGGVIRDGESLISAENRFVLGFFSPLNSSFRYVGIWHRVSPNNSYVWVANRERPISGNSGVLTIGSDGNLLVLDGNNNTVWSSNITTTSNNVTAVLMGTGNLILSENGQTGPILYQSFDNPTDTYLPDMRVHMTDQEGERRLLTAWRTFNDPSPGNYSLGVDPRGSPQIVIWEGQNRRWRSGHWSGVTFIGITGVNAPILSGFRLINEGTGRYYFIYTLSNNSALLRFWLSWDGIERQGMWDDSLRAWDTVQSHPVVECDRYNLCGQFATCNQTRASRCACFEGFVPQDRDEWNRGNRSGGCVRRSNLSCVERSTESGDGFIPVSNVKLPDFTERYSEEDERGCERLCLANCSCTAYAFVPILRCMIWNQELVDVQQFDDGGGNTLFVRVARSELSGAERGGRNQLRRNLIIIFVTVVPFFLCIAALIIWRKRQKRKEIRTETPEVPKLGPCGEFSMDVSGPNDLSAEGHPGTAGTELPMFDFSLVAAGADNFANKNKLGHGGFGEVYKATLPCGKEIAVKRLSLKSSQGLEEFKNEITVIAKLQHRNLVKLLGCSIQGEEKLILLEYMPNKSLDSFLFDEEKKSQLDWSKRFNIIEGIARGILYLHRDSRLRIIHRDLKAGNILLDEDMNPKITDFGMARIFGGNQNEENTLRVVGTYGYMAPEYAMEGLFSVKSDVYSFGVLLLEIITGRRNISFRAKENTNIIKYAWDLFHKGMAIELPDPLILNSSSQEQMLRCIHIAMLCVQDNAENRPDMAAVLLMLESDTTLSIPRQPTVTSLRHVEDGIMDGIGNQDVSSNNVTVSVIIGR